MGDVGWFIVVNNVVLACGIVSASLPERFVRGAEGFAQEVFSRVRCTSGGQKERQQLFAGNVDPAVRRIAPDRGSVESFAATDVGRLPCLALVVANDPRKEMTLGFFFADASLLERLNERPLPVRKGVRRSRNQMRPPHIDGPRGIKIVVLKARPRALQANGRPLRGSKAIIQLLELCLEVLLFAECFLVPTNVPESLQHAHQLVVAQLKGGCRQE